MMRGENLGRFLLYVTRKSASGFFAPSGAPPCDLKFINNAPLKITIWKSVFSICQN